MPFTLSHAAATLPLRYLLGSTAVFPALVIGCFIPDIPYFLPDPLFDINTHLLPGLMLFGIPCGYVIYALWQHLFLRPSLALLPRRVAPLFAMADSQSRVAPWWSVALSLFAGAASHIVWDAFTHRRGMVVYVWPALAQPLVHAGGFTLTWYTFLQHASTMVGLAGLMLYLRRRLHDVVVQTPAPAAIPDWSIQQRLLVIAAMSVAAASLVWCVFAIQTALPLTAYNFVCRSISSAAVVAAMYALGWHAMYPQQQWSATAPHISRAGRSLPLDSTHS